MSADAPDFLPYEYWINSQLSIARFYGGCTFDEHHYTVDEDTGDLVKDSFMKQYAKKHKTDRLKQSTYAQAKAKGEV